MKRLTLLLLVFTMAIFACEEDDNTPLFDNTNLVLESHEMLDTLKRGETLKWAKSAKDNYQYSIVMAPVSTNDEDSIWDALARNQVHSKKNLITNEYKDFQLSTRDQYIAVLVVKYPKSLGWKNWFKLLDADNVRLYSDVTILIGDGDMPIGNGCTGCCDTGSYTCPDGEHTQTCKCVNNHCWKKICGEYSKLEKIPEI